jgi:hypothetical protein
LSPPTYPSLLSIPTHLDARLSTPLLTPFNSTPTFVALNVGPSTPIRVGDSPGSLRQRLLTNMMVLGTLTGGLETLEAMVGADGPCVITDGGAL